MKRVTLTTTSRLVPVLPLRSAFVAMALQLVAVTSAMAGQGNLGNPGIAPPQVEFRGRSYSEWSAAWFRWVMSLPSTHHPLFDSPGVDCSEGQAGDVWFIGGVLGAGRTVNRSCTIPAGTALFLNITSNGPVDNTGCDSTGKSVQLTTFTVDQLRSFAHANLDSFIDSRGMAEIDGVTIQNLSGLDPPYRVQSSVFSYTVPALNNLLILINGPCYNNPPAADLAVPEAVADGVYLMIEPLPIGQHTLRFGNPVGVPLGNVYHITVTGAETGSASRVGVVPRPAKDTGAQVRVAGRAGLAGQVNLAASSVTIERLLNEAGLGGVGELVRGAGGVDILPITLVARPGGTADAAIFESPSGSRPSFRVEVKNRDPEKGLLEFSLKLDRGTIPAFPDLCAGQPPATLLATSFTIEDGVNPAAVVSSVQAWRCSDLIGGDPLEPRSLRIP